MDLLGPIVQILLFLWDPISRQIRYVKGLSENLNTLKKETDELKCIRDGVQARVDDDVSCGKTLLPLVQNWLEEAGSTIAEVDSITSQLERGRTSFCCADLNSRRRLGKRVIRKIDDVKKLKRKGDFSVVAESPRRGHMPDRMQVPQELEQQRSSQEALEEISQWLKNEEEVHVICVWGMGGVGKTTLVKEIYNRVNATNDFHQVIWVTVSKDLNLEVIQKKIGSKLGLTFDGSEGIKERLYARLRNVRYLLILDDLWCEFSLDQVGFPQPNKENGSKIVITTRLNEVSNAMEADRQIKIKPLQNEEAWNLFYSKTDDVVLLPEIRPLAEMVVNECGGLPLAIITVGRAMRRKDKKELWQHALTALKGAAPDIRGMERQVFLPLKLSYDCLEDSKNQSCFLYCSLYPEDYEIDIEDLVTFWAFEEGLVNNLNSLEDAKNKGHDILEKLMDVCLLDQATYSIFRVRMHDLLRDLAIWITSASSSSSCLQASKFLVKAGEGLEQPPEEKMWEGMTKISLMKNQIAELQMVPNCPDLVTLFLDANPRLRTIGDSFFRLMPELQVLNLSGTGITSLPLSLSQLVNLRLLRVRDCRNLQKMPPLGDLKELQLLDLSYSGIESLPEGIARLERLKYLDLSRTDALAAIPSKFISGLTSLENLGLFRMTSEDTWREVVTLPRLTSLSILLPTLTANVIEHPIWSRLSRFHVSFGPSGKWWIRDRQFQRSVHITGFQDFPSQINLNSLMQSTKRLSVEECQGLESLFQIIGNDSTTSLKYLTLHQVEGMRCVVDWRKWGDSNALECLEELFFRFLPSLEKVFDGGVPTGCRQLRRITIQRCPKLKCIFSSDSFRLLHQLENLHVLECEEIEEIVERGQLADSTLQQLQSLNLTELPKLTAICSQHLHLTSVKRVEIVDCPELKTLPVLCSGIQKINGQIRGSREWWEGIVWEDEHSKSLYSTIYKE